MREGAWAELFSGLLVTLQLTAVASSAGVVVAVGLALLGMSRRWYLRLAATILVEVGRGTPVIVMLQIVYYGLPSAGIVLNAMPAAWVALGLITAAYSSEIIRAAMVSVPEGQLEAARALGVSPADTVLRVVIPQALRICLAPLLGLLVQMFQATSLAFVLSVPELLSRAYDLGSITFRYVEVLAAAGVLYALIAIPAMHLVGRVERRSSRGYADGLS